jgi:hypothetical protein
MTTRNLVLVIALLSVSIPSIAQSTEEPPMRTLIGNGGTLKHSGWGAVTTHYTRVMDQDAMLVGVRGGWLINHRLTIGLAGQGQVVPVKNAGYDAHLIANGETLQNTSRLYMGYGGLLIEPIIAYRSPVHVSLPLIIGAGGLGYSWNGDFQEGFNPRNHRDDGQAFFVVEPGVELEFNLIPLVRLGVGASYRYTSDLDLPATPKDALRGVNAGVSLKIGRF